MQILSTDDALKQQSILTLSGAHDLSFENELVKEESVAAMLRFFHSQGVFLWYEDLPETKDIVIIDPQWLSDQLRTFISHRPSIDLLLITLPMESFVVTIFP